MYVCMYIQSAGAYVHTYNNIFQYIAKQCFLWQNLTNLFKSFVIDFMAITLDIAMLSSALDRMLDNRHC